MSLPTKAKVVIIGGGIHGLSTAWKLSETYKNPGEVIVLEKKDTAAGASEIEYHFRYETSQIGAAINSALGNDLETNNYDLNRGYNDYNFGVGGPIIGIPKLTFWVSGQFTTEDKYSVYEFDDKSYEGPKYFLNESDLDLDVLQQNKKNVVYPWDDVAGFRGFGFEKTWDIIVKLTYKFSNKLRVQGNYWQVGNHRQSFNPRYLYLSLIHI